MWIISWVYNTGIAELDNAGEQTFMTLNGGFALDVFTRRMRKHEFSNLRVTYHWDGVYTDMTDTWKDAAKNR